MKRRERVIGALLGSVAGDALGAPWEFSQPFPLSRAGVEPEALDHRPSPLWEAGEWTDDSQQAILVAQSILRQDDVDPDDIWYLLLRWFNGQPKDVGMATATALGMAQRAREVTNDGRIGGNGSIMRATPLAIFLADRGRGQRAERHMDVSLLTHHDVQPAFGCVLYGEMIRVALLGQDPIGVIDRTLGRWASDLGPVSDRYREVLDPGWSPLLAEDSNGTAWVTLGTAVWALRQEWTFRQAMWEVIELGGDTDTAACVAGGLLGSVLGVGAIPEEWVTPLHGATIGHEEAWLNWEDLAAIATELDLLGRGAG